MIMTKPAAVTNVNPVRANAAKPVAVEREGGLALLAAPSCHSPSRLEQEGQSTHADQLHIHASQHFHQ